MRALLRLVRLATLAVLVVSAIQALAQTPAAGPAYLDPSQPRDVRVDDLLSRMTLEEKASQLVNTSAAIPRLQVPQYDWWSEALHGVANSGFATVFPQAIGLGATWDTTLMKDVATVIGTEARAKHHEDVRKGKRIIFSGLTFWSPNINIFRDPRWGRGQETYGEDPYLTSRMGVAFVKGMQGDDPKYLQVVSTPKHYGVHSGPEPLRHVFDAVVSKRDMEDTYFPAFRATVMEGKARSVMCVYNSVNGEPGCANTYLLEDKLRGAWGFKGYVVSDCDAVGDIYNGHHFTKSLEEAAAISLKRGTDLDCAGNDYARYVNAVKKGFLTEKDIDVAVRRLLQARFDLGMFDPPEMIKYAQIPYSENDSEPHRQLALKAARESMVLLKNNGVLPLKPGLKRIAVVGPLADSVRVLEGNYNGTPSRPVTALAGIQKQFAGARVTFVPGTTFLRNGTPIPSASLATADGKPGLNAEYFSGIELAGEPVVRRVDQVVDFDFSARPRPEVGSQNFSVRWTGFIVPKVSGNYAVGFTGDDGYRVWLDGKLISEDWTSHSPSTQTQQVTLEAGHRYPIKVEYFQGIGGAVAKLVWSRFVGTETADAVAAAKNADVVVAVVGITSDLEGEEMTVHVPGFKGGDRISIDLPKEEDNLLKAVKASGKPLVVVLMSGSALAVNWANENADAILQAWYPGEEGGTAIAETLAGANNPAGRLPVTFYKSVDQLPPFEDYAMKNRTYRYFEGEPLYAFGFGLSYSKFEYSDLNVHTDGANGSVQVSATIKNVGSLPGDEVAQLYLSKNLSKFVVPKRALQAFDRFHLKPEESKRVTFTLTRDQLTVIDDHGQHLFEPGEFTVAIGGQQPLETAIKAKQAVTTTFTVQD